MSVRYSDFNSDGDLYQTIAGEFHSQTPVAVALPSPGIQEHASLKYYFEQINKAQSQLRQFDADESDEDFFDFGPEDFDDNPSSAEALYQNLSDWRQKRLLQPSEPATSGEKASLKSDLSQGEAQAPSPSPDGSLSE